MSRKFYVVTVDTCPACYDGRPCQLCGGSGAVEERVDLVAALNELGILGTIATSAEAVRDLRATLGQHPGPEARLPRVAL